MLESQIPQREVITISPLYRWLTIIFALVSLILAGFILSSILGKSTIIVTPKMEQKDLPFFLSIYKKSDQISSEQAGIVADIRETNLEKDIVVALPQMHSTSTKANGIVKIINNSKKEQTLVINTQLMASNSKIYRLNNTIVSLPGKEIKVSVTADGEGEGFDIGETKLKIVKLRADLQPLIYGTTDKINREQSGKVEINEQTTAAGLEEAKKLLSQEIINQLKKTGPINEKTVTISFYRQSFDVKSVNQNGELIYTVGAIGKAAAITNQDIANVIAQNLPMEFKDKYAVVDPLNITFQIEYSTTSDQQIGQIKGTAKLSVANVKINKNELVGKSVDEVKTILNNAGVENVNIILPFWQKKLPRLINNIEIQVKK